MKAAAKTPAICPGCFVVGRSGSSTVRIPAWNSQRNDAGVIPEASQPVLHAPIRETEKREPGTKANNRF